MSAFQNVLVGLDVHQQTADAILARACELADPEQIEAVHACNHLHHEHHDYTLGSFETSEALDDAVRRQAEHFLERVCAARGITRHRVIDGRAAGALHAYAMGRSDLVVVGSHGHHGARALFASTSNAVIHGTPCDVLAVHIDEDQDTEPPAYGTVLAAVDLGEETFQVMEEANRVALHCGARLAVCNVAHSSYDPLLADAAEQLEHVADAYGIADEDVHEIAGHVAHCIQGVAKATDADLVVIGTHGKRGLQLLTGSTANAVLHGSRCDVLAVRMH